MLVTSYDNFVGAGEVASWAKEARNLPVETSKGEIDSMKIINLFKRTAICNSTLLCTDCRMGKHIL